MFDDLVGGEEAIVGVEHSRRSVVLGTLQFFGFNEGGKL